MKASELRIGNLIEMPFLGNVIIEVIGIALADRDGEYKLFIQSKDKSGSIFFELPDKYSPIPLTEEWLLNFGYKKRFDFDDCNLYDLVEYSGITKNGLNRGQGFFCLANFLEKEGFWIDLQSRSTLKYVHQLQNLYFAITGEELTIK